MMPGEEKHPHHSQQAHRSHHAGNLRARGQQGVRTQEPAPRHHIWHSGLPSGHPYPYPTNGPPGGYPHQSPSRMQQHNDPMMHGVHPDSGYPSPHMRPHEPLHSTLSGNYYPAPHQHSHHSPYYGHAPPGGSGPSMNHPEQYYHYGGAHIPPPHPFHHPSEVMDYGRADHGRYNVHHYNHSPTPPHHSHHSVAHDPRMHQYTEASAFMLPSSTDHGYILPSSTFSVDSRSTGGHTDQSISIQAGNNQPHSFPTHVGLKSIADDSVKAPSPPSIPAPPSHEPHEISAPSSLDETEGPGGRPLRISNLFDKTGNNRFVSELTLQEEIGSSEKRETLDTASVLLAFSTTKRRPSSTTSTLDDTDALSLATMSTLPHSIAPPENAHSISFSPPTEYPKRLAMPDDKDRLNQLHCYMRSELLELVVIQPADSSKETDSFSKVPTSSDPQQIGRVGLRCVHCSMSTDGGRTGPSMSIFYPKSTGEIYRLVTSWKRCHLSKCKNIPKSIREELEKLNEVKARGKTSYWSESATLLGLVNMPTKIGGICFAPAAGNNVSRSNSLTSTMPSETTQTTVTADSHSPESLPTISDTSTLVGEMDKAALLKSKRDVKKESV